MKQIITLFFLTMLCSKVQGQHAFRIGLLPGLNVNKSLAGDWGLNFKTESRLLKTDGLFSEPININLEYGLTDVSAVVSRKLGVKNALATGYLIRFRSGEVHHRFAQQFTIVRLFDAFRLAHRFSTDQTIVENDPLAFRLRYRISFDLPLNGQSTDPKEFYFKLNHEYLNEWQGEDYDLEIRMVPIFGFVILDSSKIEWGLDYRLSSFINDNARSSFWLTFNWYLKI